MAARWARQQTSFKRRPWLARRCSCWVWVVKPSGREGSQSNGIANERRERQREKGRGGVTESATGTQRMEAEREKEGRETVIFSCARFFVFYFPRMTAFYLRRTTQRLTMMHARETNERDKDPDKPKSQCCWWRNEKNNTWMTTASVTCIM